METVELYTGNRLVSIDYAIAQSQIGICNLNTQIQNTMINMTLQNQMTQCCCSIPYDFSMSGIQNAYKSTRVPTESNKICMSKTYTGEQIKPFDNLRIYVNNKLEIKRVVARYKKKGRSK